MKKNDPYSAETYYIGTSASRRNTVELCLWRRVLKTYLEKRRPDLSEKMRASLLRRPHGITREIVELLGYGPLPRVVSFPDDE